MTRLLTAAAAESEMFEQLRHFTPPIPTAVAVIYGLHWLPLSNRPRFAGLLTTPAAALFDRLAANPGFFHRSHRISTVLFRVSLRLPHKYSLYSLLLVDFTATNY